MKITIVNLLPHLSPASYDLSAATVGNDEIPAVDKADYKRCENDGSQNVILPEDHK